MMASVLMLAAGQPMPADRATAQDRAASSGPDLIVRYDQSRLVRLPRGVTEVIVGNPSIADVTLRGDGVLVVTGKTYGITNVIGLDAAREVVVERRLQVERDQRGVVHLHRGGARQSFSCVPGCSPMLVIGDDGDFFDRVLRQNQGKTKFSETTVEKESGQ